MLEEACNPAHPLLERLRFLSISANNLDEFYMVRVAGLKARPSCRRQELSPDGLTPTSSWRRSTQRVAALITSQQRCWRELTDAAARAGMPCSIVDELTRRRTGRGCASTSASRSSPVLTPKAIDPAHPFPFIPNSGFGLVFELDRGNGEPMSVLVLLPGKLARFIRLPGDQPPLHRARAADPPLHRPICSPASRCKGGGAFRVIRDSDIEIEEEAEDLVRSSRPRSSGAGAAG